MSILKFEKINKTYANGQEAVKNADLTIGSGEFMVLVGPSGCGKSTMLRMVAGLEDITSGSLTFADVLWNDLEPKKRNVGMVFQNYALYPHLTVAENLAFPLSVGKVKKDVIKSKVAEIAEMIGLTEYLDRKPKQLSGGQRQRVALGRAIIRKPNLFLFDEPLSNLDAKLRVHMRNEIKKLHEKFQVTSLYVTHDQVEAMTMGTKLAVMNKGEIMQADTPANIYSDPDNIFVAGFIGSPEMNFFKGNISGGKFRENGSNIEFVTTFPDQNNVTAGIRPEELYLETGKNTSSFEIESVSSEYLGHETIINFFTANTLKRIRIFAEFENFDKIKIKVYYNPENIKYFDEKGNRIRL